MRAVLLETSQRSLSTTKQGGLLRAITTIFSPTSVLKKSVMIRRIHRLADRDVRSVVKMLTR